MDQFKEMIQIEQQFGVIQMGRELLENQEVAAIKKQAQE
jgi:hypothetical protein